MNASALKPAVLAVAELTRINPVTATRATRHNPILNREKHITEELINLQESIETLQTAGGSLRQYPDMYYHAMREKKAITRHCVGLVVRMMQGRKLAWHYTEADIRHAVARLVQLVVDEAHQTDGHVSSRHMDAFRPFLTLKQRIILGDFNDNIRARLPWLSLLPHVRNLAQHTIGKLPVPLLKKFSNP